MKSTLFKINITTPSFLGLSVLHRTFFPSFSTLYLKCVSSKHMAGSSFNNFDKLCLLIGMFNIITDNFSILLFVLNVLSDFVYFSLTFLNFFFSSNFYVPHHTLL